MSEQGFKHCSVLVVDDSAPARTLIATTLHAIGVGSVHSAPHGAAAIQHLSQNPLGAAPIDLVICEWDMAPVGGEMLNHWIRRSEHSPNKFMHTMVMSGQLNMEKVEAARDAGVNAVFSKPFSFNTLKSHISNVFHNNPAYFKTTTYFGPDRRRRALDVVLDERRLIADPKFEVLGVGTSPGVGCFDLPDYLNLIAGGRSPAKIDYALRQAAHQSLYPYNEDYADWIKRDMAMLNHAFRLACENADMRSRNISLMHGLVLRMEKEGDYLNYPLAAAFSHTLKNALETDVRLWTGIKGIIQAALNGLEVIVRSKSNGDGGAIGIELHKSLKELDGRFTVLKPIKPVRAHRKGITF